MCGRYGRRSDKQRIAVWFQTHNINFFNDSDFAATYNVAPFTFQPVIRLNAEAGEREIALMRWSLVPSRSETIDVPYSTINAAAENLITSPVWRVPFKHRRCLVPADWFYEWPEVDGEKQARAFSMKDDSPFAFAGLWDRWENKGTGELLESFAIVTMKATEWMAKYHKRMPVIIKPKDYQRWLDTGDEHQLPLDLLEPSPEDELKSWRVSDDVGNYRNNWAALIEPVPEDQPKQDKVKTRSKRKTEPPSGWLFE